MCSLVALSVALMVADQHYYAFGVLKDYLSLAAYPVHMVIDGPTTLVSWGRQYIKTYRKLQKENAQLLDAQLLQNARVQKYDALEAENARLRALLQSPPHPGEKLLVAEIIQVNSDPFIHRVVLDKGAQDGVTLGQPVIDAEGVMGEVIEVHTRVSRVILLTDANYGIPVENVRNGVRGIAAGTGAVKRLELQHIASTIDLAIGDKLVTSGLDGRYPPGFSVGTVSSIEHDPADSFAKVLITPSAHLERTRQVLLVQRMSERS